MSLPAPHLENGLPQEDPCPLEVNWTVYWRLPLKPWRVFKPEANAPQPSPVFDPFALSSAACPFDLEVFASRHQILRYSGAFSCVSLILEYRQLQFFIFFFHAGFQPSSSRAQQQHRTFRGPGKELATVSSGPFGNLAIFLQLQSLLSPQLLGFNLLGFRLEFTFVDFVCELETTNRRFSFVLFRQFGCSFIFSTFQQAVITPPQYSTISLRLPPFTLE